MHRRSAYKFTKYFSLVSLILLFALVSTSCGDSGNNTPQSKEPTAPSNTTSPPEANDFVKGEVLVRYKASAFSTNKFSYLSATVSDQTLPGKLLSGGVVSVDAIFPRSLNVANAFAINALNGSDVDTLNRWRLLKLADGVTVQAALDLLSADPDIEVVAPNYLYQPNVFPQTDPDDLYFPLQYGLKNTTQTIPGDSPDPDQPIFGSLFNDPPRKGKKDADIDAELAWQKTAGGDCSNVIVGVIDTGIDTRHTDLIQNLWVNPDEIPNNNLDDDNNGYVDDVYGYDFFDNDADPMDQHGHGTHVAGIIGAVGNNAIGTTGVCTKAKIMALRFIGPRGGPSSAAAEAIHYAVDNGAAITNNSWGGPVFSQITYDAIEYALTAVKKNDPIDAINPGHGPNRTKMLFVVAAGNDNVNLNTNVARPAANISYPAAIDLPNVIVVGASDNLDERASFSNYGTDGVDLMAPGVDIASTVADLDNDGNDHYFYLSGTSMAAPHVAGVAALVASNDPGFTVFEPRKLKARLIASTDYVTELSGLALSGGRLNANAAVDCTTFVSQPIIRLNIEENFKLFAGDGGLTIKAHLMDCQDFITDALVTLSFDNGEADIVLLDDGLHGDELAGDGVYGNFWNPSDVGKVTLSVTALNASNQTIATMSRIGRINRHHYIVEDVPLQWIAPDIAQGAQLQPYPAFDIGLTLSLPANFSFPFYGKLYSEVTVSRFGYLTFGNVDAGVLGNTSLPEFTKPNNMIAVFWDGLGTGINTKLYTQVTGTAPNRTFTITWSEVLVSVGNNTATFQVSLNEGSSDIVMRYLDIDHTLSPTNSNNFGGLATVGIEDAYGIDANLVLYNPFGTGVPDQLTDKSAIRFYPIGSPDGNSAPTAVINSPAQVYVNSSTVFDASSSIDVEGDPLTYIWDMGDGTRLLGDIITHTYTALGPYTVTLIVYDGIQYSSTAALPINVVAGSPQIVIDTVTVTPASAVTGTAFSLSATVRNTGTGRGAGSVAFSIVSSPTGTTSRFIGNAGFIAIGGGPSVTAELIDSIVPTSLPAGSYVVRAVVGSSIIDSTPFNVTIGPDLELVSVDGPTNITAGSNVKYSVKIRNNGVGTLYSTHYDVYFTQSPSVFSASDTRIGFSLTLPIIRAGETVVLQSSVNVNATLTGTYYWAGVVDAGNDFGASGGVISESNETNNIFFGRAITFGGDNLQPIANFTTGQTFTGAVTIFNASTSSDPDDDSIQRYKWSVDGSPFVENSTRGFLSLTFTTTGLHTIALIVNDGITDSIAYSQTIDFDYGLDLKLSSLNLNRSNLTGPPIYKLGDALQMTFTVSNISNVDSRNYYYEVQFINAITGATATYPLNTTISRALTANSSAILVENLTLEYPTSILDLRPDPVTGKIMYFARLLVNGSDGKNYPVGVENGYMIGECPTCRTNNFAELPFELQLDYDLIATMPVLDTPIVPQGYRLSLSANTINIGTSQVTNTSVMRYKLYKINDITGLPEFNKNLGDAIIDPLFAKASQKDARQILISTIQAPGDYIVYAVADAVNNQVAGELSEDNNRSPGAPLTIVSPSIDFTVTDIVATKLAAVPLATRAFDPVIGVPEQGVLSVSTTVTNQGATKLPSASKVTVTLSLVDSAGISTVLDTWGAPGTPGVTIPGLGLVLPVLDGGISDTHVSTVQLGSAVLAGNYRLVATIDPTLAWTETDETNNTGSIDLNLVPGNADLVALHVSSSNFFVAQGTTTRISTRIFNSGSTPTTNFFNLGIYLSLDGVINTSKQLINMFSVNGLAVSEQKSLSFDLSIPPVIAAGCYTVGLIVDYTDRITECAGCKANNILVGNKIAINGAVCTIPPIANAGGSYSGIAGGSVNFDGSGSIDPNNGVLTYSWNFGDNTTGTGVRPSHVYATSGSYNVTLVVTNGSSTSTISPTVVEVSPVTNSGLAVLPIGNKTIIEGQLLTFNVNATPVTASLAMSSASVDVITFTDNGNGSGQFSWMPTTLDVGVHSVTFTATDGVGNTVSETISIVVDPISVPLIASMNGPYTALTGAAILFDASATQLANVTQPATYTWVFSDGITLTGIQVNKAFSLAGDYTVTLTVTNGANVDSIGPVTITVTNPAPTAPVVSSIAATMSVNEGNLLSFVVTADGASLTDFSVLGAPAGSTFTKVTAANGTTQTGTFSWNTGFDQAGLYNVTFSATSGGLTSTVSTSITVNNVNRPPVALFSNPGTATIGTAISFDATSSSDPDADAITYLWDFGDNSTSILPIANHTYAILPASSTYTVTLTVNDGAVNSAPVSQLVSVVAAGGGAGGGTVAIDLVTNPVVVVSTSNALVGEFITMSGSIQNTGIESTVSGVYVDLFMSTSDNFDANTAIPLGRQYLGIFAAGASAAFNITRAIPGEVTPGSNRVIAIADYFDSVTEADDDAANSNFNGNNKGVSAAVNVVLDTDIVLQSVSSPAAFATGNLLTVTGTIANTGTGRTTTSVYINYYLSTDTKYDAGIDKAISSNSVGLLSGGQVFNFSRSMVVSNSFDAGNYYVLAVADVLGIVAENDDDINKTNLVNGNNVGVSSIMTLTVGPDYSITAATAPATIPVGLPFDINYTATNLGNGQGDSFVTIYIYLSTSGSFADKTTMLGFADMLRLDAGAFQNFTNTLTIRSTTPAGSYHVLVGVDPFNNKKESDDDPLNPNVTPLNNVWDLGTVSIP